MFGEAEEIWNGLRKELQRENQRGNLHFLKAVKRMHRKIHKTRTKFKGQEVELLQLNFTYIKVLALVMC